MSESDQRAEVTTETETAPETERQRRRASRIVRPAAWSAGAGLIPIPLLDLAALRRCKSR
jgi:hypothetical protein